MIDLLMLALLYSAQLHQGEAYQANYLAPPALVTTYTVSGPEGWRVVRIKREEEVKNGQ